MISVICACGGEFWVRDRLAGRVARCPSCEKAMMVPPAEAVRALMTPQPCSCGEIFWSSSWREGKRSKCPICSQGIPSPTPATSEDASPHRFDSTAPSAIPQDDSTTVIIPGRGPARTSKASRTASPPESRESTKPTKRRPAVIIAGIFVVILVAIGSKLDPWPPSDPPNKQLPPVGERTGGLDTGKGPETNKAGAIPDVGARNDNPPEVGAGAARGDQAALPAVAAKPQLRLIVPAYFYPADVGRESWDRLINAASRVPVVAIVNPASGPGDLIDPAYQEIIRIATAHGVTPIGYVYTNYGNNPINQTQADIKRWVDFYPEIGGFFLDAQASSVEQLPYYSELRDYIKQQRPKALIVSNPGTICDRDYIDQSVADVIVFFENLDGFEAFDLPEWRRDVPAERFAVLPYNTPTVESMKRRLGLTVIRNLGYVYITDGTLPDPYGTLPSYWDEEVDAIQAINEHRTP